MITAKIRTSHNRQSVKSVFSAKAWIVSELDDYPRLLIAQTAVNVVSGTGSAADRVLA
jgi:hypothetical protein